jgi:hypothetical protein
MKIKLELDINVVNGLLALLGSMPWAKADPIIRDINEQMKPQIPAAADKPPA